MAPPMDPSAYPARKCREPVFNDFGMAYNCEAPNLHLGPCMNYSVQRTVKARKAWEDANPGLVGKSADGGDIIL
jgi:hypothetical protein